MKTLCQRMSCMLKQKTFIHPSKKTFHSNFAIMHPNQPIEKTVQRLNMHFGLGSPTDQISEAPRYGQRSVGVIANATG